MKPFYVSSGGLWFVVYCKTKLQAKQEGIEEFGSGQTREVRKATQAEVDYYRKQRPKLMMKEVQ